MINNKFEINGDQNSMAVDLRRKIGRNDPCYCGSGKKYKNCCMKKDQEEERIKVALEQCETVADKYLTVKEYIELSGYPIVRFDYFLLEILNMAGSILDKYNKTSKHRTKEIIRELYGYAKGFYGECLECKYNCLKDPLKRVSFKSLRENEFNLSALPSILQQEIGINFFYIEFLNGFAGKLFEELLKDVDEETAVEMSLTLFASLIDYVSSNCAEQCENKCIRNHNSNAYCNFCTFGDKKLPCPKEGKVSYEAIKALEIDMIH
ncbi:SEC-C metal-binding domain-containing protein [Clostridium sp. 19966]|uniref:YecA family protein n=1 Tax=Clostridium sp. 19966 TaxID=2768166 RepID=UPI0028E998DC|nr:SEC-C metal-binding domain-containing protein [Clostridium sp. 19966]